MTAPGRRVVVIGGGLAGIAAALDCAQAGAQVTLLEVRRRLGGAIYSFERDGLRIDNGQHVFMRCCVAYRALLARIGSDRTVSIQPRLRVPVLSPGAPPALLARRALPAPLHMAGALARYPHLSIPQRFGVARAALGLARMDPHDGTLDRVTFGEWLARHGQDRDTVDALWDVIVRPTLNLPAAEASLALGAFVFRNALLDRADAGDMGFHRAALSETVAEPAERALSAAGVEVRFGWRAQRLERTSTGFEVHGHDDGLSADAAIVALPHQRAGALLGPLLPTIARNLHALGSSPIVNLHVVYDRPVCDEPFAAGVRTPVQYLFDRTTASGAPPDGQYLAVSLSAAEREMQMSVDALRERYLPALRELLPRAREANVESFLVTREHAATFRAAPGVAALRPGARTDVPGLVLAGAWTDTGWPATLESAVLSGHAAARVALGALEPAPAEVIGKVGTA
ncbi:MAG TPA: hydroxysqualene dehydroxylase HpnE [Solirubrobacteraceae bacterium]|jgi:squalene-associated FAD-dependent desaturase|nr:hydroxysqualene dehydroxylase HpnE [Solirubrobacteraceae bacterium]